MRQIKRIRFFSLITFLSIIIAASAVMGAMGVYFPCFLSYEAESESSVITSGFEKTADSNASGGYALKSLISSLDSPPETSQAPLKVTVLVERAGKYYIHIRAKAQNAGSASCWFSVNSDTMIYTSFLIGNDYSWRKLGPFFLDEGANTINIGSRHLNLLLDKIVLTKSVTYVPVGMGDPPTDIFGGDYENEFADSPYPLPDTHPRLLVKAEDIPLVKEKFNDPFYSEQVQGILSSAEQEYTCLLPKLTGGASTNHNNSYLGYIESNAFLYLINETESNAEKAIDGIISYLGTLEFSRESTNDITREAGYAIFISAEVYDWCYDILSEEEKRQIIRLSLTHASNMETGWPPVDGGRAYISGHESEAQIMRDLFAFSVAVFDEYPDAYNIVSDRIFNEFIPVKNYFYQGSFHNQGTDYGPYRMTYELYLKWILNKIGYGELLSDNQLMTGYGFLYARRPDGNLVVDGDVDDKASISYTRIAPQSLLFSGLYGDPYFKNELYRSSAGINRLFLGTASYSVSLVNYLLINNKLVEAKSYEGLPLSRYFGNQSGMMIARTGWEDGIDSNTLIMAMKTPERFFGGHGHFDAGEFEIYYKGPLALDSGVYRHYGSAHDYGYHKQTIAHNAMLIYDPDEISYYGDNYPSMGGQRLTEKISGSYGLSDLVGEATEFGKILGYGYAEASIAPSYTYLKGDLTKAYNKKAEKYTRSFMFFNFFDNIYPGALIVFDKVTAANEEFKKTWLLHSQEEPEITRNLTTIRRTEEGYNGRLINETLLPGEDNRSLAVIGGPGKEFLVGDTSYAEPVNVESGNYRIELSPIRANKTDYFLNVLQVADNTLNPTPLESQLLESGDFIGVKIKDRVALFSRLDERTKEDVSFTVESEDNLIFAVCDLKEGLWEITKNGEPHSEGVVNQNSGILSFEGAGGDYTLTYSKAMHQIDITVTGSGVVSDYPRAEVIEGERKTFEVKAEPGNCVSQILFNGEPVTVLNDNRFTTPYIASNSVLEVVFSKTEEAPVLVRMLEDYYKEKFPNSKASAVLGEISGVEGNVVRYGVIYSKENPLALLGQSGVRDFQATNPKNDDGIYGIQLIDLRDTLGDSYYIRNYVIELKNGINHIKYSENSVKITFN